MSTITLPLLSNQYVIGYPPKEGKTADRVQYFALTDILTRGWTTDAHTTAYSVPYLEYRLKDEAVSFDGGVTMVLFFADVDCEQSHAASVGHGDVPAPDDWWVQELPKIDRLREAFPDPFAYRTRGGYRLIELLPEPRILRSNADVEAWKADYLAWVAALRLRFQIYADPACFDWQRLYRVPHATRTRGGRPEHRETIGNPYHIGTWTCTPTDEERELAKTLTRKKGRTKKRREDSDAFVDAGDGVFFHAFKARGWIGKATDTGMWTVRCPWQDRHTKGDEFDSSTVLYAPGLGDTLGYVYCKHAHCQSLDTRDVLNCFSRQELDDAERAAGLPPFRPAQKRSTQTKQIPIPSSDDQEHFTDLGNAKRFAKSWHTQVRYVTTWEKWLIWTKTCWALDQTKAIERLSRQTVQAMYAEAAQLEDSKARQALAQWAMQSESRGKLEAMIALAQAELPIPMTHELLDADPWAFNCANGTIDLRTGTLQPHRPEDLLMKESPVFYDPRAPCPRWERFLREVMADNQDLIDYLQRAVGSSLTADVSDQCLFFLYGAGANGKSKFLEAILTITADYGMQSIPEFLTVRNSEHHPTERADLFGKRFVATVEIEQGKALAEALVKQLTGGEKVRARRMREDFWEFPPTHKLWLAANHKPVIRGTDHAIWRRIKLVPFTVTFVDEPQDEHERKKDLTISTQLRAELPGILRWAVEGCIAWQKQGLDEPKSVTEAVDEYRLEMNSIGQFLQDCCYVPMPLREDIKTQSSRLHEAYLRWSGEHNITQTAFSTKLTEMGYRKKMGGDGRNYWLGIGLVVTTSPTQDETTDDSGTEG
jgi:P4 family phage/plasmid primase-like protien